MKMWKLKSKKPVVNLVSTPIDNFWDNDYANSLSKLVLQISQDENNNYCLKIPKPFDSYNSPDEAKANFYKIRSLKETNLHIAQLYKENLLPIFKLALNENTNEQIWQDIELVWKVLIYSDANPVDNSSNYHQTLLNWNSLNTFAFTELNIDNTLTVIPLKIDDEEVIDSHIDNLKNAFTGSNATNNKKAFEKEVNNRIQSCLNFQEYACWNWFHLIFNDFKVSDEVCLRLFKVLNYLLYKQCRIQEVYADAKIPGYNVTSSDALSHLHELETKILPNTIKSKMLGLNTSENDYTYSTDICNFYVWKTKVLEFFSQQCFNAPFYQNKDLKHDLSINSLINEPLKLNEIIDSLLQTNKSLNNNPTFLENKAVHTKTIMELLNENNLYNNIYLHWYYYYLTNYNEHSLMVNNLKVNFNDFEYLVWLSACFCCAIEQMYKTICLVLKYASTTTLNSLKALITKYNGISIIGTKHDGYRLVDSNYINEVVYPFIESIYNQLAVYGMTRFNASLQKYLFDYKDDKVVEQNLEKDEF